MRTPWVVSIGRGTVMVSCVTSRGVTVGAVRKVVSYQGRPLVVLKVRVELLIVPF